MLFDHFKITMSEMVEICLCICCLLTKLALLPVVTAQPQLGISNHNVYTLYMSDHVRACNQGHPVAIVHNSIINVQAKPDRYSALSRPCDVTIRSTTSDSRARPLTVVLRVSSYVPPACDSRLEVFDGFDSQGKLLENFTCRAFIKQVYHASSGFVTFQYRRSLYSMHDKNFWFQFSVTDGQLETKGTTAPALSDVQLLSSTARAGGSTETKRKFSHSALVTIIAFVVVFLALLLVAVVLYFYKHKIREERKRRASRRRRSRREDDRRVEAFVLSSQIPFTGTQPPPYSPEDPHRVSGERQQPSADDLPIGAEASTLSRARAAKPPSTLTTSFTRKSRNASYPSTVTPPPSDERPRNQNQPAVGVLSRGSTSSHSSRVYPTGNSHASTPTTITPDIPPLPASMMYQRHMSEIRSEDAFSHPSLPYVGSVSANVPHRSSQEHLQTVVLQNDLNAMRERRWRPNIA